MKTKSIVLMVALFAVLVSACGTTTPTAAPAPTQVPTQAPPVSADPVWDRIQAAGKITFGTSADYQPFEYYDSNYQIVGFDADLARELGARLGMQVELVDIAFEGLTAALEIGQIDAAIAAISVTPERQVFVDFTNIYYTGQDMVLAREGSGIAPIVAGAQLAQYRVGVERGSVYASWVRNTFVDSGLMPAASLLEYEKPEHAVRDLKESRNDVVILDKPAAEEYIRSGGVVAVAQNLNTQLFAIALPKGAAVLQSQLNAALAAVQNDGTVARLANTHLEIVLPTPAPEATATPAPTATAIPGPTPTPVACRDGMEFVKDVQVPDGTQMNAGQDFDKTWRIRNTGTCTWNSNYTLVFVQGDRMGGTSEVVKGSVKPGETYDMIIDQKAPNAPGKYTGIWQMVNAQGTPFGERIWVKITVPGAVPPTAVPPTATAPAPVQPTLEPPPTVNLAASDDTIKAGDLVVISWSFSGTSLVSAKLTRINPDGSQTPLNGGADVAPDGRYEDILMNPGTYSYALSVSSEAGTTVKTVVVDVKKS